MRGTYPSPHLRAVACFSVAACLLVVPTEPAAAAQPTQVTAVGPGVGTTQSVLLGSTWLVAGTLIGVRTPSFAAVTGTYTLVLQYIAGLCAGTFIASDNLGAVTYPVTCSAPATTPGVVPLTTVSFGLRGLGGSQIVSGQLVALSTAPILGVVEVTFDQG